MLVKPFKVLCAVIAAGVCLSGLPVLPASASVTEGTWTFSGAFTGPSRSTSDVTISVSGSLEVSQGLLDGAGCSDPSLPAEARIYARNQGSGSLIALEGSGISTLSAGTSAVDAGALVAPGSYALVMVVRCGTSGSWGSPTESAPPTSLTIASLVSSQLVTRACRPTTPESACTSAVAEISAVPTGLSANFSAAVRQTWSDGVVTEVAPSGSQRLESAPAGSGAWSTAAGTTCSVAIVIASNRDFRCVSGSGTHTTISITAMPDTSAVSLATPSVTPATAMRGDTVRVTGSVSMTYGDGTSWPAPTSVQYRIEYQASGTTQWVQVAGPYAIEARGAISRSLTMPGAGKLRLISGSSVSPPVDLVEATAQSTYTWSNVVFPAAVNTRGTLSATARVQQSWSDGIARNPANGTSVEVQFATAYSTLDNNLQWRTFTTVSTSSGNVSLRVAPVTSGFWRFKLGSAMTAPAFVQLTGSTPLQLTASISPKADDPPFAKATTRFDISAALSGYAGASSLALWVTIGTTEFRVSSFSTNGTVANTYSIKSPDAPGNYTPRFDLKDPSGAVVATTTGNPIVVDGYTAVVPTVALPAEDPLVGESVTITAKLVGTKLSGKTEELDWSGQVELQELKGDAWEVVATRAYTSGKTVSFSFKAIAGMQLRVFAKDLQITGPAFTPRIAAPTGTMAFDPVSASSRVVLGEQLRASASFKEIYSNGKQYAVKGTTAVTLQVQTGGSWQALQQLTASNGSVSVSISPKETATYRFFVREGSASSPWTTQVVAPGAVSATWSSVVRPGKSLRITLSLKASDGGQWTRAENILIQFQAPSSATWKTVRTVRLSSGRSASTELPAPRAGNYRALVSSTQQSYALEIPRPAGGLVLSDVRLSTDRAQEGQTVSLLGSLSVPFTDGKTYPYWGRGKATLEFAPGTEGIVSRKVRISGSRLQVRTRAQVSGRYRIVLSNGTASEFIPLTVVYPVLGVQWPQEVDINRGLVVRASIKASDDRPWRGVVTVNLQYRPSTSGRWQTKSARKARNGATVTLIGSQPGPGEYRVFVPSFAIEEAVKYGIQ